MTRLLPWIVMLAVAGCSKKDAPAPAPAPPNDKAAEKPAETSPAKPPARPAGVTDDMVKTYDLYVTAFEKIMADVTRAGTDCELAASNVKADLPALDALAANDEQLRSQLGQVPDAKEWFGETYGPRFKAAIVGVGATEQACKDNANLKAVMEQAMSKFPMMRKKG